LQPFGEFLLKRQLVRPIAAPYLVRWIRQFLSRQASDEPLADQVRHFCDDLERSGIEDWQVRQAEQALRIYFVNFLDRTDWRRRPIIRACQKTKMSRFVFLQALMAGPNTCDANAIH